MSAAAGWRLPLIVTLWCQIASRSDAEDMIILNDYDVVAFVCNATLIESLMYKTLNDYTK